MKKLIYQVYVGPRSKLYDYCTASVKNYAGKIGADYIIQTEPILRIRPNPFSCNRSYEAVERLGYLPIYEKENAFDYLNKYDQICIIDSDVWIRPTAANIFESLPPDSDFGAVIEREMPLTDTYVKKIINYSQMQYTPLASKINFKPNERGYEFMNMGVMLMNKSIQKYLNGQTAHQFITRPEFQGFVDGNGPWKWSTDQTLLNAWIRQSGMKYTGLHWKWNGLYTANTKIHDCYFIHFFLKDKLPNKGENVEELMRYVL